MGDCGCEAKTCAPRPGWDEYDQVWVVRVAAADFAAGFATVDTLELGLELGGPGWLLDGVLAVLPRNFVRVRRGTATAAPVGGTLPQTFNGLRYPLSTKWDGVLVLENDPAQAACDHFLTFIRNTCE